MEDAQIRVVKQAVLDLPDCSILLIVPPFSSIDLPCIGLDILQTISNRMGIKTAVFYANILFAKVIGIDNYQHISSALMSMHTMLGERIFARSAYESVSLLGENFLKEEDSNFIPHFNKTYTVDDVYRFANIATEWIKQVAHALSDQKYDIVGVTTGHQQTNAAIALINALKGLDPNIICIIGGSACDGDMAEGILSLSDNIDYVFSGEGENSWSFFLQGYKAGTLPTHRIIYNRFINDLDEIEINSKSFQDYFHQLSDIGRTLNSSLLYESSRGCWYGERNKCNFCGVNGWNKHFRYKSEKKVLDDLSTLLKMYPHVKRIQMVDTLMPRHYLNSLLPTIKERFPSVSIFYEQRADLSLDQIITLKKSGINYTQVGIEALTTELLGMLNKGIHAKTNIRFLRYAKCVGLLIGWNLLTEIPNDKFEYWKKVLDMIPFIHHLNPPLLIRPVEVARFSPYHENPERFGITNVKPDNVYSDIFPTYACTEKLAWLFSADFKSDSKDNLQLSEQIIAVVSGWIARWKTSRKKIPALQVEKQEDNYYIRDSRLENNNSLEHITRVQARLALHGIDETITTDIVNWGIKNRYIYHIDGDYVPLATAHPAIIKELEK